MYGKVVFSKALLRVQSITFICGRRKINEWGRKATFARIRLQIFNITIRSSELDTIKKGGFNEGYVKTKTMISELSLKKVMVNHGPGFRATGAHQHGAACWN